MALGRDAVRAMGVEPSPLAWQIDSFGHSATTAKILKEAGIEATVYNRADKSIKDRVQKDGALFTWSLPEGSPAEGKVTHPSSSSGPSMTGILLLDHYNSPATSPFSSSKLVTREMIEQAASSIYKSSYLPLHLSKSQHLLYPIGDDNAFLATAQYFEALDAVVDLLRSKYGVNAIYSTSERYWDSVGRGNIMTTATNVIKGEMTRYIDKKGDSWGGHFSSRIGLKQRIRALGAMVHNANAVNALAIIKGDKATLPKNFDQDHIDDHHEDVLARQGRINEANKRLAMLQHHDAITGTCSRGVMEEFRFIANEGIGAAGAGAVSAMRSLGLIGKEDEGVEEVVVLGGGVGGTRGFNKMALGAMLGKHGWVELAVFNGRAGGEAYKTRRVEGYVPCGVEIRAEYLDGGEGGQGDKGNLIDVFVGADAVSREGGGLKLGGEDGKMGICRFLMDVEVGNLGGRSIGMIGKERAENEDLVSSSMFSAKTISGYIDAGMIREQLARGKSTFGFRLNSGAAQGSEEDGGEVLVIFELVDRAEELYKVKATFNGASAANANTGTSATIRYFPNFPDLYRFTSTAPPGAYTSKYHGAALNWVWVNILVAFLLGVIAAEGVGRVRLGIKKEKRGEVKNDRGGEEAKTAKGGGRCCRLSRNALLALAVTALVGVQLSISLNQGSIDFFLKPTTLMAKGEQKSSDHAGGSPSVQPSASRYNPHVSLPGIMIVRETMVTLGFVLHRYLGAATSVGFLPTLFLSSALHTLLNPIAQSRRVLMRLPKDDDVKIAVTNQGKGGFFTASVDMGDNVVLRVDKHGTSRTGGPDEVEFSVKVAGFMDREYLVDLEKVKREGGANGQWKNAERSWFFSGDASGVWLDDGLTTFRHGYKRQRSAQQNLLPFISALATSTPSDDIVYSTMQPVAATKVGRGRVQLMVSRSTDGDDEKGLGEGIGKEEDIEVSFKAWFGSGGLAGVRSDVEAATRFVPLVVVRGGQGLHLRGNKNPNINAKGMGILDDRVVVTSVRPLQGGHLGEVGFFATLLHVGWGDDVEVDFQWFLKPASACKVERVRVDGQGLEGVGMEGTKVTVKVGDLATYKVTICG